MMIYHPGKRNTMEEALEYRDKMLDLKRVLEGDLSQIELEQILQGYDHLLSLKDDVQELKRQITRRIGTINASITNYQKGKRNPSIKLYS